MNTRLMTSDQQDQLEALIDRCGLNLVLGGIANICAAKSDHVLVHYQDRALADAWMKAMTVCDRAGDNRSIAVVSE